MMYNEVNLVPYFQPIISVENNKIYGYEVLGRNIDNGEVKSLGDFFNSDRITSEEQLDVDRVIRKKAIVKCALDGDARIFINMRLDWLSKFSADPQNMPTIKWLKEYNVDFSRVVIEISESNFNECDPSNLVGLSYYKSIGMKIAIDDYGKEGSNIYRLVEIAPDIIKIDMGFVQKSENLYQYRYYLENVTAFANKLGIEVVYEGVENEKQLLSCINAGGRYYQGYFLAMPQGELLGEFSDKKMKNCFIQSFINNEQKKNKKEIIRRKMDGFVSECQDNDVFSGSGEEIDQAFLELENIFPEYVKRVYLCNMYGFQVSSNVENKISGLCLADNVNNNWAWRGYFKEAVNEISDKVKSYITHSYRDISDKQKIYTYVNKVNATTYLFADIESNILA